MKTVVYDEDSAKKISPGTEEIHLVRPVNHRSIKEILKKCSALKKISLSKSCFQRMPEKTKTAIRENGTEMAIESRRGRAIGIGLEKMLHVIEMRKDFQPFREIENITGIPKSTVHYLVKYAQRGKVKKGNSVVYLK